MSAEIATDPIRAGITHTAPTAATVDSVVAAVKYGLDLLHTEPERHLGMVERREEPAR
jgi:hypothetical protein